MAQSAAWDKEVEKLEYQERLEYQPTTSKVETTGDLLGETKTGGR